MRLFTRIAAAASAAFLLFPCAASAVPPKEEYITVIAATDGETDAASALTAAPGSELLAEYSIIDGFAARIPARFLEKLRNADGVTDVHLSATFTAPAAASTLSEVDPSLITEEDGIIRAEDPLAGSGRIIAVLDSGFDVTHPVFALPKGASPAITEENYEEITGRMEQYMREFEASGIDRLVLED